MKIKWEHVAIVIGSSLLAVWLVNMSWDIVEAIRQKPVMEEKVIRLEQERDSLMDELFNRDVELTRMVNTVEQTMTKEEQEKFWEWLSHNTE
jgi:hypothetical protein